MYWLFFFHWMKYPVEHPQRKKSYLGVMLRVRLQKKKKQKHGVHYDKESMQLEWCGP